MNSFSKAKGWRSLMSAQGVKAPGRRAQDCTELSLCSNMKFIIPASVGVDAQLNQKYSFVMCCQGVNQEDESLTQFLLIHSQEKKKRKKLSTMCFILISFSVLLYNQSS